MVSFAKGGKRAGATATYVQRDGVALETDDMRLLHNHEEVQAEIDHWTHSFDSRKSTDDVVTVQVKVNGLGNTHGDLKLFMRAVDAACDGHRWALGEPVCRDGSLQARVVTVMAGTHERFRLIDEQTLADKSRMTMLERVEREGIIADRVTLVAGRPGHGVEAAAYRLSLLAEQGEGAMTDRKAPITSRLEARNLAREWKRDLHSFEGRDTMHVVVSAKGDTDMDGFKSAVRAYLHESFPQNRFMWGVHSDKKDDGQGHIHAHAIVFYMYFNFIVYLFGTDCNNRFITICIDFFSFCNSIKCIGDKIQNNTANILRYNFYQPYIFIVISFHGSIKGFVFCS